jgi:hypothetical protein
MIECFLPVTPLYLNFVIRITEMLKFEGLTKLLAVMLVASLAGCGNKGPLYLPEHSSEIFYTDVSSDV